MNSLIIIILVILSLLSTVMIVMLARRRDNNVKLENLKQYINGLDESNRRNIETLRQSHSMELQNLARMYEQKMQTNEQQWRARLDEIEVRSRLTFEQISRTALDDSVGQLKNSNGEMMNGFLAPLAEQLAQLSQLIHNVRVETATNSKSLSSEIATLSRLNVTISNDAKALTDALKGNSKVQGDWGETILRTILEKAGLEEGVNYRFQPGSDENGVALKGADNNLLRPDFIILLPEGRKIIVDSKVSLTDYLKYCETDNEEEKRRYAKRHLDSVKNHINELRRKHYENVVSGAMEHVLMFMPNEGAYLAAMRLDPDLWKYAYDHKVVMLSAPHLLSAIQIIAQMWRQERQDRNAQEIARVAGLLYDSFASFREKLQSVGGDIERVRKNFDTTMGMLNEDNSKSIMRRAMKLKELGAKTSRSMSE